MLLPVSSAISAELGGEGEAGPGFGRENACQYDLVWCF